jgi:hypothetical protein
MLDQDGIDQKEQLGDSLRMATNESEYGPWKEIEICHDLGGPYIWLTILLIVEYVIDNVGNM